MKPAQILEINPLFTAARDARLRLPGFVGPKVARWIDHVYPIAATLFCLIVPILSSIPVSIIASAVWMLAGPDTPIQEILYGDNLRLAIFLSASFLPIFFLLWIWLLLVERRSLISLGLPISGLFRKYLSGMLFGFLMISISVGIPAVFGFYRVQLQSTQQLALLNLLGLSASLLGWIIQGAAEEILLRGYLMPVVSVRYGPASGIILSSLAFMALHLLNENLTGHALINLALFGIFASIYALAEGSLWGIFAIHSVWNWTQGSLLGLSVSGARLGSQAPIHLVDNGPAWLTGGAFGPEGGIMVTLVLLISIAWIWISHRRKISAG